MAILVTGGAGYIGSHTCVELQNAGYDVVVLDNLSNSSEKSLDRVKAITGKNVKFYKGDILDRDILNKIFENEQIDSCINFAGLKAVGESVAKPWEYYNNNIAGTLTLVDVMRQHNCKNIIFSSSATVYGDPAEIPITENCPKGQCTNPYGWTKSMLEQILKRLKPIAEKQNIELVLESFRPVSADVDEVKITLAFTNLIENAVKYNRPDGWVHVSLNADHQYFYLKVEDCGIGIPEESLEHIYERFYRVDKSHSREIGGTGLGLAITRSAVLMHRGAIKVFSTVGEGTIFNVRIPLNYIS